MDNTFKFPIRELEIPSATLDAWQHLLDLMAEVFHVPSALIMRVHAREIEVCLRSENPENVYKRGESARLDTGLYCETAMATRKVLLVPNAMKDPVWDHNPDIKIGMIAYLGFPLLWPTGEVFGTICALDRKENFFSTTYVDLLEQFKMVVEHDLALLDASLRLQESETRYRTVFNTVRDGIFVTDLEGLIIDTNDVARDQLDRPAEEFKQLHIFEVIQAGSDWATEIMPQVQAKGVYQGEAEQLRKTGEHIAVDLQVVGMTLGNQRMIITMAHDISQRKALEQELQRLATTDGLTGVGNRASFERALAHEITHANRYQRLFAIAMLDIDHFKQVNDRFGHETGDRVLCHVCDVTAKHLRETDQFYRYGGEEFIVVMSETTLEGAAHLAERIRQAVEAEQMRGVGGVTVSIGGDAVSAR
jgi:diguanylate cyclase (GGDEF)-like protein/PAS domain S-box-containing protein